MWNKFHIELIQEDMRGHHLYRHHYAGNGVQSH
nr:MAG TPA: hypothetical protein [Caudoviricetes sp.]